jgi:spectinomycin phosphotransferase
VAPTVGAMRTAPEGIDQRDLVHSLEDGWGLEVERADYVDEGFGSYHWVVIDRGGNRHFATADDLERKEWLGSTPESAFAGLKTAFDTAAALRDRGGLEFVVAPRPALGGETVRRMGARYSIAVFPFVEGRTGTYDQPTEAEERAEVVRLLVRLHRATPIALPGALRHTLELSGRGRLEAALGELGTTWDGGPYSEPARALLAARADTVVRLLGVFDRLVVQVVSSHRDPVITHGEPHSGNWVRTEDGLVLVDWDTASLSLPERDLWIVATEGKEELAQYSEATGLEPDKAALTLYRVRWDLDDIAIFVNQFRRAHSQNADTELAWFGLSRYLDTKDRWEAILD